MKYSLKIPLIHSIHFLFTLPNILKNITHHCW